MLDYGCPGFFDFPDHKRGGGVGDYDRAGTPEEGGGDDGGETSVPARGDVYVGEGALGLRLWVRRMEERMKLPMPRDLKEPEGW